MSSMERPTLSTGGSSPHPIRQVFTDPAHAIGTRGALPDGRVFYYACNPRNFTISRGTLCQTLDGNATAYTKINVSANAGIGDTKIELKLASTSVTPANYFAGGFLTVQTTSVAGRDGYFYRVIGNDYTATDELTVFLDDPLEEVLTTSTDDDVDLSPNQYQGMATHDGSTESLPAGVPLVDVPIGTTEPQYFWIQSWGPCAVLTAGATALGLSLTKSGATAGAVGAKTGATSNEVAWQRLTNVSTDFHPVYLRINP